MKIFNWFSFENKNEKENEIENFTISLLPYEPNESVDDLVKSEKISNNKWKNTFKFIINTDNIILTKQNKKQNLSLRKFTQIIEKENYAKCLSASIYFNIVGKSFYNRLNYFYSSLFCSCESDPFECITINEKGLSIWCLKTNKNINKILMESSKSTEKLVYVQMVLSK